jgi:hypothetical protein
MFRVGSRSCSFAATDVAMYSKPFRGFPDGWITDNPAEFKISIKIMVGTFMSTIILSFHEEFPLWLYFLKMR